MKRMFATFGITTILLSGQAFAACVSTESSYSSGTIPANSQVVAWGPKTITLGTYLGSPCPGATFTFTVNTTGTGPSLAIDRKSGSSWIQVASGSSSSASVSAVSQPSGEYRLRLINGTASAKTYTGTVRISK